MVSVKNFDPNKSHLNILHFYVIYVLHIWFVKALVVVGMGGAECNSSYIANNAAIKCEYDTTTIDSIS